MLYTVTFNNIKISRECIDAIDFVDWLITAGILETSVVVVDA